MKALIIGAGIGGIAAAIRTASLGYEVDVYELADGPGGKLSSFELDGHRFDRGPSLFTMPQYVDELFELCGENPRDYFKYQRHEVVCRYFWESGERLMAYDDPKRFSQEAARVFGVPADTVLNALHLSERKLENGGSIFLEKPLHKLGTWLSDEVARALTYAHKMDLTRSMHETNTRNLVHPKLVQLFDRFATYNGSNPYQAPGILTIIPSFEHLHGTYLPVGGMYDITAALVALAERQGVRFHYNQRVKRVLLGAGEKAVAGIELEDATRVLADLVVSNSDVHQFYDHLLPEAKRPERTLKQERSTSALIFYWGINHEFEELGLHNIFFSEDYKSEFEHLQAGTIADDFTVYVNITSKYVLGESPDGQENWFVMVNAPYDRGQNWEEIIERVRTQTIAKLTRNLNLDVSKLITTERTWTPPGIAADTGSHLGALYGTSSNSKWAAFLRHRNKSSEFDNLYFVGGSVHPGGGVPLALLSAKIAYQLMQDTYA